MTTRPEAIRQSELLNQLVLDRTTMEELGRVEVLWIYPQSHRVLGFICRSGLLGNQKTAFQLGQLVSVGANGLLIQGQPEKTTADRVRRLESLIEHEIWSEEGNRVGRIIDCLFDLRTGEITGYLFTSSGWGGLVGELYQLPPYQILSFGKQRVLVLESARFELYRAGLSQKLSQRAEATTEQAKEQLQQLTEQAKTRAQRFSQQFSQKTQVILEQAKEKTQVILEQAKEKTHLVTEQMEAGLETLTLQAEEAFETVAEELSGRRSQPDREDWDFDLDQAFDFDQPEPNRPAAAPAQQPDRPDPQVIPNSQPSDAALNPEPDRTSQPSPNPFGDWGDQFGDWGDQIDDQIDDEIANEIDVAVTDEIAASRSDLPSPSLEVWDDWDDVWDDAPAASAPVAMPPAAREQPNQSSSATDREAGADVQKLDSSDWPATTSADPDSTVINRPKIELPNPGQFPPTQPDRPPINLPTPGLPNSGLPNSGLPNVNLPIVNLPNANSPDPNLPKPTPPTPEPQPDLPGSDGSAPHLDDPSDDPSDDEPWI